MLIKLLKIGLINLINIHLLKGSYFSFRFKKKSNNRRFDVSHHGGKNAVASAVRFSSHGPEKSNYRLFNIPKNFLEMI
jgi:hypothetical protein